MPSKILILLTLLLGTPTYVLAQSTNVKTVFLKESRLSINGSSNVNDFECVYNDILSPDSLNHEIELGETSVEVKGDNLSMNVDSFECGKRGINRDFRKTLKSNVYPTIDITLERLLLENGNPVIAEVLIKLAGISRMYQVQIQIEWGNDGEYRVVGSALVKMSDFNLDPPKALFGLVQVRDEMDIRFNLIVIH